VADLETSGPDLVVVDLHAEGTSEKQAMGYHLEGRAKPLCDVQKPHAKELGFHVLLTDGSREVRFVRTTG
jgi:hypothetical protein